MGQRIYILISSVVFLGVAAAHLTRLLLAWHLEIGGWTAPHWISFPGLVIPGLLSTWGFALASRARGTT